MFSLHPRQQIEGEIQYHNLLSSAFAFALCSLLCLGRITHYRFAIDCIPYVDEIVKVFESYRSCALAKDTTHVKLRNLRPSRVLLLTLTSGITTINVTIEQLVNNNFETTIHFKSNNYCSLMWFATAWVFGILYLANLLSHPFYWQPFQDFYN